MHFECEKCGDVDAVIVDGYHFGDRLLEGVMIKAFYKDGELVAEAMPDSASYFNDLNTKKWLAECIEYVKRHEDDVAGECPCCGEDIYLRPQDLPLGHIGPRTVNGEALPAGPLSVFEAALEKVRKKA